ncbi:MAG: IS21-like element helper ATPase IstB [Candidatus Krumholzibacteriia bacterium]
MTAPGPSHKTQADVVSRVRAGFATLRLPHAVRRFDELLAGPEPDLSRLEWLWAVLEPQVRARTESQIERRIKQSRLPERKTLAAFDFDFQAKLDKDLVLELATLAFLDHGKNVLLAGWSGTGKSHIAKALALNACLENRRVRYTTSADMLATLNASLADATLEHTVKRYTNPQLLVIDEVGLEQVERAVASRAGLMQKVLLPRYNERRSTIITSNIEWKAWGDYLGDHLGAAAILDRLLHHSHVIVIEGPSWRDHEHKQDVAEAGQRSAKHKRSNEKAAKRP